MGTEENKAAQRRIIDQMINQKNLDSADELFSEEHKLYPESSGVGRGPEGMKRAFAGLHEEFPDIRVEIESMVAEADMVAVRLTFRRSEEHTSELQSRQYLVCRLLLEKKHNINLVN